MASNIYKFFVLLLLYTSCVTHENQLQSNAEISIRTTLQEVNADSGLIMLMDSAGNVIAKSSLSLLNGKPLEDKVYTTNTYCSCIFNSSFRERECFAV